MVRLRSENGGGRRLGALCARPDRPRQRQEGRLLDIAEKRDSIAVLLPENVDLRPDRSARARDTRLKIEAMLRNRPVVGEPVAVGHRAAMDLLPFQLVPAQTVLRGDRDTQATRKRAETVLRTNGFQAYAAARYRQQKAGADGEAERAWALDAWTGEELATTVGTRASVRVPEIPAGREVVVIHSHAAGSAALSPRDALAATKPGIEGIEAVTFGGDWQRVKAQARSPQMQAMLQEWAEKHDAAKRAKNPAVPRKFREEWKRWLDAQNRLGYLELKGGTLT